GPPRRRATSSRWSWKSAVICRPKSPRNSDGKTRRSARKNASWRALSPFMGLARRLREELFCRGDQGPQPIGFGERHSTSERGQPIGGSAFVALRDRLSNQALGEQPLDDAVQGSRAEHDFAICAALDVFEDPVPVLVAVGKRQEHVEERGSERQKGGRIPRGAFNHVVTRYVVTRRMSSRFEDQRCGFEPIETQSNG